MKSVLSVRVDPVLLEQLRGRLGDNFSEVIEQLLKEYAGKELECPLCGHTLNKPAIPFKRQRSSTPRLGQ